MFHCKYLYILLIGTVSANNISYNVRNSNQYFEEFVEVHDKLYGSIEEAAIRSDIFRHNLEEINVLNKESNNARFGVNQFSDMTLEEFLALHTGYIRGGRSKYCKSIQENTNGATVDIPPEFDWRSKHVVTSVKDQGTCGSCWAFSVIGNLESVHAIKTGELLELSKQQLVDCDTNSNGCTSGYPSTALTYLIEKGAILENEYPYDGMHKDCKYDGKNIAIKVTGCLIFSVKEEKIAEQLYSYGPLSIAIDATPLKQYTGGVLQGSDCKHYNINHAVLLVGYGVDGGIPYWLVKNSWGETWGENGYFRIERGINCIGIINDLPLSAVV